MKPDFLIPRCGSKAQRIRIGEALTRIYSRSHLVPDPRDITYLQFCVVLGIAFVLVWAAIWAWA